MGLFETKTEELKLLKQLIRNIRNSSLNNEIKEYLTEYLDNIVNNQKNNDFFDVDFLNRVIIETVSIPYINHCDIKQVFSKLIEQVKFMFIQGKETDDYDKLKELFINNYCGANGYLALGLLTDSNLKFYSLFQNKLDYIQIMNLIKNNNDYIKNINVIYEYAINASPYMLNQEVFKSEIISFISSINQHLGNLDDYKNDRILTLKKQYGIYPIDEKTLAMISDEAIRAQGLIERLSQIKLKIDDYEQAIDVKTKNGLVDIDKAINTAKKDIMELSKNTTRNINNDVDKLMRDLVKKLDEYIITLENNLRESSNVVFNKVLEESKIQLKEIKDGLRILSTTTTEELLKIQKTANDSVEELKDYVTNEPMIKELLKNATEDDKIRQTLLNLDLAKLEQVTPVLKPTSEIVIPSAERIIVPANEQVVIPQQGITYNILPAFDENIAFDKRIKKILKQKELREANGEIFHEKTEEIIRCVMEGDWPYLWGPSGCGKTHTIKQIADLIGIKLIDNGKITDKYSVMAYNDPQGRFRATQTYVAVAYGNLLLFDEFDNGNPDTQVILNTLYSGLLDTMENPNTKRYVTFAEDMMVQIHPNFRMISAGNTTGEGENQVFSSRGQIDESVQERMTPIHFNYDNRVEKIIFGDYKDWYQLFIDFRKACDSYAKLEGLDTAPGIGTTRDASAIVKYIKHNSKTVDQVLYEKFIQTKNAEYLGYLVQKFREYYKINGTVDVVNYNGKLSDISSKNLAKKFIYNCEQTISIKKN